MACIFTASPTVSTHILSKYYLEPCRIGHFADKGGELGICVKIACMSTDTQQFALIGQSLSVFPFEVTASVITSCYILSREGYANVAKY